jgi:hypothetical protein
MDGAGVEFKRAFEYYSVSAKMRNRWKLDGKNAKEKVGGKGDGHGPL